jgi:hypothetical protein
LFQLPAVGLLAAMMMAAQRTVPALAYTAVELGKRFCGYDSAGTLAAERQYPKAVAALSAKEFPEDCGSPWWNLFLGKEFRADLQGGFRSVDADDIGEQAEVVDVPGPGGEGLHREDVAW